MGGGCSVGWRVEVDGGRRDWEGLREAGDGERFGVVGAGAGGCVVTFGV